MKMLPKISVYLVESGEVRSDHFVCAPFLICAFLQTSISVFLTMWVSLPFSFHADVHKRNCIFVFASSFHLKGCKWWPPLLCTLVESKYALNRSNKKPLQGGLPVLCPSRTCSSLTAYPGAGLFHRTNSGHGPEI